METTTEHERHGLHGRAASTFRKKPVTIEAVRYEWENASAVFDFCPSAEWASDELREIRIPTQEGDMLVSIGDWVIKGVEGEFYPCKPSIFEKTYEAVDGR